MYPPFLRIEDFNPRSREGSDIALRRVLIEIPISIHAPVKGATDFAVRLHSKTQNFNPRSREGSDVAKIVMHYLCTVISIHAPVKGATPNSCAPALIRSKFQSTLP